MNKVQLTLTTEEASILSAYGQQFGYSLPKTIKYVISKAAESFVREQAVTTYKVSEKMEKAGQKARQEYLDGKTVAVKDTDEFFDKL